MTANRPPYYPSGEWDARKWAEEFVRIFPDKTPGEGAMIGWFANAIMTGYDQGRREVDSALHELGVPTESYPAPVANAVALLQSGRLPESAGIPNRTAIPRHSSK